MMRTFDEIVARMAEKTKEPLIFEPEVLLPYLPFEQAALFLNPDVTAVEWASLSSPLTRESVLNAAKGYMVFAWEKALDHRGLSAGRSVEKIRAWIWLLGDEDLDARLEAAPHKNYGAPVLKMVCIEFEWSIPDDDAAWRMAEGLPCREGCDEGCAS